MADDIIERRKQLLQRRLREQNLKAAAPEPVPARTPGTPSPLSDAQRRMWFLQRLDPADTTLNVCVAYRLTGPLDTARLHAACACVLARHEILRTTYGVDADGEPFQVSSTDAELPWKEHDLSALPEAGRARRVEVLARREFARPFDLSVDLPVRAPHARTGPDEHVVMLVVPHMGWGAGSTERLIAS
ncbi:condensation domain-containing protein [Nocardia cyriacigeorgica]|uniref:condensation domain-containing protein n=1 Tax=Nocardia cyriacigeorgica TaxID=135487 RepID=UPI0024576380|nr:condensation domain-containing protein [Nocardia cyriacigeorgica]